MSAPTRIARLFRMYELPAEDFIRSITEIRRLLTIMSTDLAGAEEIVEPSLRQRMAPTIDGMRGHLASIGDQSAWVAADRLHGRLTNEADQLSFGELHEEMKDIERRFADRLRFIRLFVMWGDQLQLMGTPVELLGELTAMRFTSLWFDCEEAAKCICLQRPTAAVFHCMRMLEVGIKAFAAKLGIPDPVKPAERNWGVFLRIIKNKIDADFPAEKRMAGSEGAFLESLYVTLDAAKNPWRNEVMHVEGVYTDAEARFILMCSANFIQKMATGFDENGIPVEDELPEA